jgi:hypothetical protein
MRPSIPAGEGRRKWRRSSCGLAQALRPGDVPGRQYGDAKLSSTDTRVLPHELMFVSECRKTTLPGYLLVPRLGHGDVASAPHIVVPTWSAFAGKPSPSRGANNRE